MKKVTVSISRELKEKLEVYPQINWTEVLRDGIKAKISKLKKFEDVEGKI